MPNTFSMTLECSNLQSCPYLCLLFLMGAVWIIASFCSLIVSSIYGGAFRGSNYFTTFIPPHTWSITVLTGLDWLIPPLQST